MRLHELLTEAPIDNYDTIGDFSKNSSFRNETDRKLVTSPGAIRRTKRKFENTDYDINMLFINSPKANNHTEVGMVEPEWVKTNLGDEAYEKVLQYLDGDAVNVIFTNNKGDKRIPMTPWIIAHRMGHVLSRRELSYASRRQIQSYEESEKMIVETFTTILRQGYGFRKSHRSGASLINDRTSQIGMIKLAQEVCTFRSAREKIIRDWFEITNELFAQFLTTSKGIHFNSLPKYILVNRGRYSLVDDDLLVSDLQYTLDSLANGLYYMFDSIMMESHNRIFVM